MSNDSFLDKLDIVFGNVISTEAVFKNFYSARQMPKEPVASWACRHEDILQKASRRLHLTSLGVMLRSKIWSLLSDGNIKDGNASPSWK